jgi:iron(III) transport system permease protein
MRSISSNDARGLELSRRNFKPQKFGWYFIVLAVPVLFVVYPLGVLFLTGFMDSETGRFTLENFAKILSTPRHFSQLIRTLIFSLGTTAICIMLGVPLSFYLWRRNFRGKSLVMNLLVVPYMMPIYIVAIAVILLFGQNGMIAEALRLLLRDDAYQLPFGVFYTYHGVIAVYVVHSLAVTIFLVTAFLTGVNPNYIEAARGLGASVAVSIRKVILPLARPAITGAAILVFARTMVDYVVIETIGGSRNSTLAVEVYNLAFGFLSPEAAASLAAMLSLFTIVLMNGYLLWSKREARRSDR